MFKYLLSLLLVSVSFVASAQQGKSFPYSSHEYYIIISGITSRHDVENIQEIVAKKTGVSFFLANRYPPRYFLMRSERIISIKEFEQWIDKKSFKIGFYGEGGKSREEAILAYNKSKKAR